MNDKRTQSITCPVNRTWLDSEQFAALIFLIAVFSAGISIYTGQWHWFARSGSLVAIGGLLRSSRAILRQSIWDEAAADSGVMTHEHLNRHEKDNRSEDLFAAQFGLYAALFGTLIWGYGDLIGVLLKRFR